MVLGWADEIRAGRLGVRANADTGPDAANARQLGAEGIGLCRTEHMFIAEDRLPIVRRMILASTPDEEEAALEELPHRPAGRLRRDPGGHGRPPGDGAPARPAPARVPAPDRGPGHQGGHRRADRRGDGRSTRRPRTGTSSTPCSAPGGCASGCSSPVSTPCRSGPSWRPPSTGWPPAAARHRDHDPPDRRPRGDGPGPVVGGGGGGRGLGPVGAVGQDGQDGSAAGAPGRPRSRSSSAP